jgi:ASC-1-like (ASCH) protein
MNVGIEVTECHPENTKGKGAKNLLAARQRTYEICKFIEESQDAIGGIVNYRLGFNLVLLFDLQKPKLKRLGKERIQNEVLAEMRKRIKNGDFIAIEDDHQKLHKECAKDYHYIREIVIDKPLEKSIVTYSYPARGAITIEHEFVLKAIAEKEAKITYYQKENPGIKDFWLCVNIPMGTYRTLYGFEGITIETVYDRVYLTDHTCVRIK